MITPCGVYCEKNCSLFKVKCPGCHHLKGKVFWASIYGGDTCPIHACAGERGFATCRDCADVPCPTWTGTRDPELTDEEFAAEIARRLTNLREHRP